MRPLSSVQPFAAARGSYGQAVRIAVSLLLVLLLVPGWSGLDRLPLLGDRPVVTATPVPLDETDPARRQIGALFYLGGVWLRSPDPAFGGYSALAVEGNRFTLLSDGGNIVRFAMGADWRPHAVTFGALPAGPGTGWLKEDRDSESLTRDPVTGRWWVGFERANAIWRYAPDLARGERSVRPRSMRNWPGNGGPETMARLNDGRFVVISERKRVRGRGGVAGEIASRAALLFPGDPTTTARAAVRWAYTPPERFLPVDAAALPDGRLLVLNRRFRLPFRWSNVLTLVDPTRIRATARVAGREIATLAAPLVHDNFEGLAVTREGRDTILWLVSDDNEQFLQRTLLLKFRLDPQA